MKTLSHLLSDEFGAVLSAESVVVGTLVVIGATAGLSAASRSVNAELLEFASAIRSLDQSYFVQPVEISGDWSAGSAYTQPDVEESLKALQRGYEENLKREEELKQDEQSEQKSLPERRRSKATKKKKATATSSETVL